MKKFIFAMFFATSTVSLLACDGCPEEATTEETRPVAVQEEESTEVSGDQALLAADKEDSDAEESTLEEALLAADAEEVNAEESTLEEALLAADAEEVDAEESVLKETFLACDKCK